MPHPVHKVTSIEAKVPVDRTKGTKKHKSKQSSKPSSFGEKETRTCYDCKRVGHMKKDCYVGIDLGFKKKFNASVSGRILKIFF